MPTKMTHPDNGQTYALTKIEVESLEARGWSVAPPKVRDEGAPQKKKPGPKPKAK